jgi:hypothetical protein
VKLILAEAEIGRRANQALILWSLHGLMKEQAADRLGNWVGR